MVNNFSKLSTLDIYWNPGYTWTTSVTFILVYSIVFSSDLMQLMRLSIKMSELTFC